MVSVDFVSQVSDATGYILFMAVPHIMEIKDLTFVINNSITEMGYSVDALPSYIISLTTMDKMIYQF